MTTTPTAISEDIAREVVELARKTKEELIRRGPITGELAQTSVLNDDYVWLDVSIETCRVCLMGAAGAAHGIVPEFSENVYSYGKAYTAFVEAMAFEAQARGVGDAYEMEGAVEDFFDCRAGVIDGDVSSLGEVFDLLDTVADRYATGVRS